MSHEQKISRDKPGLIIPVLDDSVSMHDYMLGTTDPKFQWVERLFGIELKEMLTRSTDVKGDGVVVKPRYYLYVVKYGSSTESL